MVKPDNLSVLSGEGIRSRVKNLTDLLCGTQEVRLGKSHIVKTDKFEMSSGTITYCVWGDEAE